MEKRSSFYLTENEDVDVEGEALIFFAETANILFSMSPSSRNLDDMIDDLKERVGEENFKKIISSLAEGEREVILRSCARIAETMNRIKKVMEGENKER